MPHKVKIAVVNTLSPQEPGPAASAASGSKEAKQIETAPEESSEEASTSDEDATGDNAEDTATAAAERSRAIQALRSSFASQPLTPRMLGVGPRPASMRRRIMSVFPLARPGERQPSLLEGNTSLKKTRSFSTGSSWGNGTAKRNRLERRFNIFLPTADSHVISGIDTTGVEVAKDEESPAFLPPTFSLFGSDSDATHADGEGKGDDFEHKDVFVRQAIQGALFGQVTLRIIISC